MTSNHLTRPAFEQLSVRSLKLKKVTRCMFYQFCLHKTSWNVFTIDNTVAAMNRLYLTKNQAITALPPADLEMSPYQAV